MHRDSGMASGYFRDGVLVADRHGRRVTAVIDPEDGATVYLTPTGRILAKDPAPDPDTRHWALRSAERFLILSGMGFWLLVVLIAFGGKAAGQDVPDWVLRGIASQETDLHWTDMGVLSAATWPKSTNGAVGPWHISLKVLRDLKLEDQAERIHRDAIYAESVTRQWLVHLYRETGDWFEVCAAWRAGLNGRHRDYARAYAERARNYGTTY